MKRSKFKEELCTTYYDNVHHYLDEITYIVNQVKKYEQIPSYKITDYRLKSIEPSDLGDLYKYLTNELRLVINAIHDEHYPFNEKTGLNFKRRNL